MNPAEVRESVSPCFHVVEGDSARMDLLRNGEADFVVCSPPYFSGDTEKKLMRPLREQVFLDDVRRELSDFAHSLRPIFDEIGRILKPGGVMALQTKDIRYGPVLIRLADIHREMAESNGFDLINHVYWKKIRTNCVAAHFRRDPVVGKHRADEVEDILVFSKGPVPLDPRVPVELDEYEIAASSDPVWTIPSAGRNRTHPHQSPISLIRRLVALYSRPGDLVVDPFLGHGTTIDAALELGRSVVGYEIDGLRAAAATARLQKSFSIAEAKRGPAL